MSRLIGLIDASDPGGLGGRRGWSLVFHLAAWRRPGEPIESGERRCELHVSDAALDRWMARLHPYQVVSLDVAKTTKACTVLRKILRVDVRDDELGQLAKVLQRPVTRKTKRFGTLTLDRRYGSYEGRARWKGRSARLTLEGDEALETAESLFAAQTRWNQKLAERVVEKLLPLKNDRWLEEGERALTRQRFLARLKLQSVSVGEKGAFTFWFHDGGLFWGHAIQVSGSLAKGATDASIVG